MNYIQQMKTALTEEGYIQLNRAIANWANGSLVTITRQRLKNKETDDANGEPMGSSEERHIKQTQELGFMAPLPLVQRGNCFAAIRQYCFDQAEQHNWQAYDKPRNFAEYYQSLIDGLLKSNVTAAELEMEREASPELSEEEIVSFIKNTHKARIAKLRDDQAEYVAEDGTYDTELEFDEALGILGITAEHRMRTKCIDSLCYAAEQVQKARKDYPNFELLTTKKYLLYKNASILNQELAAWERQNRTKLSDACNKISSDFVLVLVSKAHRLQLEMFDMREKDRLEKQAA